MTGKKFFSICITGIKKLGWEITHHHNFFSWNIAAEAKKKNPSLHI